MAQISGSTKGYGLVLKKNTQTNSILSKPSIFADDSDSDDNQQPKFNIQSLQAKYANKANKQIKQFLDDDSDMYQYDEVYDAMEESRMKRLRNVQVKSKSSKYVALIKDMSDDREKERERRLERKYISEREKEGDEFKDKDSYTTPGYKKYLLERVADDEKERAREEQEAKLDVTKQKNLSLFYSHLLTENVAMGGSGEVRKEVTELKEQNCPPNDGEEVREEVTESKEQPSPTRGSGDVTESKEQVSPSVFEEKIDVYAKRTTEVMRLATLERYFERKRKRINALSK